MEYYRNFTLIFSLVLCWVFQICSFGSQHMFGTMPRRNNPIVKQAVCYSRKTIVFRSLCQNRGILRFTSYYFYFNQCRLACTWLDTPRTLAGWNEVVTCVVPQASHPGRTHKRKLQHGRHRQRSKLLPTRTLGTDNS